MRKGSSPAVAALVVALGAGAAGCSQFAALQGKLAFKEANTLYAAGNYQEAVEKYQEALAEGCAAGECQPAELAYSYFFIGNSYDNLFRPARKGDPKNDENLDKAIEYYTQAAEKSPDELYKKRSLQFMVAVFGAEKLNDPARAEPLVQQLIEMDPNDTSNYYQMAKLYEDAGEFEKAEAHLLKAREVRPNDPEVYGHLAGFYEARGDFEKQMEAMTARTKAEPESPEAHYRIAVSYWNRACLPVNKICEPYAGPANERARNVASGLEAAEKALAIRADYVDALAYKNLLLRSKAYLEPARSPELIKEADGLLKQIKDIQDRRNAQPVAKKTEE